MIIPIIKNIRPIQVLNADIDGDEAVQLRDNNIYALRGDYLASRGIHVNPNAVEAIGFDIEDILYCLIDDGDPDMYTEDEYAYLESLRNSGKLANEIKYDIDCANKMYGCDNLWEDISTIASNAMFRLVQERDNNGDDK